MPIPQCPECGRPIELQAKPGDPSRLIALCDCGGTKARRAVIEIDAGFDNSSGQDYNPENPFTQTHKERQYESPQITKNAVPQVETARVPDVGELRPGREDHGPAEWLGDFLPAEPGRDREAVPSIDPGNGSERVQDERRGSRAGMNTQSPNQTQAFDFGGCAAWAVENLTFGLGMLLMFSKTVDLMSAFAPQTILGYTGLETFYGIAVGVLVEGALFVMKLTLTRARNVLDWLWNVAVVVLPFAISGLAQVVDSFLVRNTLASQPNWVQVLVQWGVPSIPTTIIALLIGKSVFSSIPPEIMPNLNLPAGSGGFKFPGFSMPKIAVPPFWGKPNKRVTGGYSATSGKNTVGSEAEPSVGKTGETPRDPSQAVARPGPKPPR